MKNLILIFFILFFVGTLQAQELDEGQVHGYIVDNDSNKKEGILEMTVNHPWKNQRNITFIDKKKWESGDKIKKKDSKKFKTKDLVEFGTTNGERIFKKIKYVNTKAMSESNGNKKLGRFNKLTSLASNAKSSYFAELIQSGTMSMYRFYDTPAAVTVSSGSGTEELDDLREKARNNYDVIVVKGDDKAKSFDGINVKKYFKDCKEVVEKFKNKEYIKQPVKGIKSMVGQALVRGFKLEESTKQIVDDYNKLCGS